MKPRIYIGQCCECGGELEEEEQITTPDLDLNFKMKCLDCGKMYLIRTLRYIEECE